MRFSTGSGWGRLPRRSYHRSSQWQREIGFGGRFSNKKSARFQGTSYNNWRRGRDSNSGWDRSHDGFQDRCIKPLCHLSITYFQSWLRWENRMKLRFIDDFGSTRKFFGIFSLAYLRLRFDSKTALIKPLCHLSITFSTLLYFSALRALWKTNEAT